jgi:hypothetical protein
MVYLISYEGKTKIDFHQSLTILDNTLNHTKICPSTASDTGTLRETTKHILERNLNCMHLQMEIAEYQIAAALLELSSLILSDRFCYGNPGSLTAFGIFVTEKMAAEEDTDQIFHALANERDRTNQKENPSLYPAMIDWLIEDSDSDDENADNETADGDAVVPRVEGTLPVPRASLGYTQRIALCGGLSVLTILK